MKLILASTSKFKSEILMKVGLKHTCRKSTESHINEKDPIKYIQALSFEKAHGIKDDSSIVIGLDTICYINDRIVEKPLDLDEVKRTLLDSSDNTVKVITGITIINNSLQKEVTTYQETLITFRKINEEDIDYYLKNEKDALYVSGFVLETYMSNFIKEIKGSYYNILGAPVEKIYEVLNNWNIYLKDIE